MRLRFGLLACVVLGASQAMAQIEVNTGNVTVNVKYNGQPLPGGCFLYFSSAIGGFGCGSSYSNVLTGNYTLTEAHGYPFTPMPFTVSAGQTTVVNVETSGFVGIITGTVSLNGQPGVGLQVRTNHEDGYSGTDNTGRFRFIALAGPGIGTVGNGLATFNFNAVAGQIRDLGSIGATSLFGSIVNKPGSVPNKQWNIRVANTGSNAAANTKLDSLTLTQTFGSTCTPTITSTFPINLGLLTAGSSADTSVSINFNTCAANSRFTAVINSSANSGAVTNSRSITNQQP